MLKAAGANLIVEEENKEMTSSGGIIVPNSVKRNLIRAIVRFKGPGFVIPSFTETDEMSAIIEQKNVAKVRYVPLEVDIDDVVYF